MNKKIYYFLTFSFAFLFMFLSGCADSKETLSNTLEISATSSEENSFSQNDESVSNTSEEKGTDDSGSDSSQPLLYSITINLDGGTSSVTILQFQTDRISSDILPFDVKKKGFVFRGYELNGIKVYDEKGNIVNTFQTFDNMTFKAIYEESVTLTVLYSLYSPNTHQLIETFDKKPSDMGNVSETSSYNYNTYVDLFAFANEGYTFVGWYNEGQVLSNEKDYKYMMWNEDFTIEARFEYTLYDLTLWSNNDDLGQVMIRNGNSQTFYNEETLEEYYTESVTIVAYSKTDTRRFLGWYDENNELVSTNAVYTFNMLNKDYTLEAKWDYFSINYDLDGGINNSSNPTYYTVGTPNITLREPTKQGYTFQGWEYNGNLVTAINTENICHMDLKALWTHYTLTTGVNNSKAGSVSSYSNTKITKGKSVTITATTNSGYTFNGWYNGDELITGELSYTFAMPSGDLSYIARWTANTNTPYKVEHYWQNIDDDNYTLHETDNLTGTTDTLTRGSVKTYEGFTSPSITQVNINGNGQTVIKLNYIRCIYPVSLTRNIEKAGTVTGSGRYKYGKNITITATTNSGYTFNGWYNGDELITGELSYTFAMPSGDLSYIARWAANTNTTYKVEHYLQNIGNNNYTLYETEYLIGTTDTQTNGSVKTYEGFTSPSITQVNINGNGETEIKLNYTRNSYTVELSKSIDKAGAITGAGTYKYGKGITITAETNEGYTFNGWYKNDELYIEDASFDYTIGAEAVAFEARYTVNKYTITIDNQADGGIISGITSGEKYDFDTPIVLTVKNSSSLFLVWIVNEKVEHVGNEYAFRVPANDVDIITTISNSNYVREENKIYFGTYPQTRVINNALINELNTLAGKMPLHNLLYNWIDYNYYENGINSGFMYYQDIDYDNNGTYDYRGVYFTKYRPVHSGCYAADINSFQDDNGYLIGTIYWFNYDPIEWCVLSESEGKALIVSNLLLDSQEYYPELPEVSTKQFDHNDGRGYGNNYELSEIRKFLNNDFYNLAFNDLQKELIETTTVDNSASSTGEYSNYFECNNTNDRMFLLSYEEATIYYTNGIERQACGTDYAKVQGLQVNVSNGNSYWWLRSPCFHESKSVRVNVISNNGNIVYLLVNSAQSLPVYTYCGVRPACWINLL